MRAAVAGTRITPLTAHQSATGFLRSIRRAALRLRQRCTCYGRPFGEESFMTALEERFARHWGFEKPADSACLKGVHAENTIPDNPSERSHTFANLANRSSQADGSWQRVLGG